LRIKSANFLKSAVSLDECPAPDVPEFAFIGRSNVGKSSLINLLTRKEGLARVSKTPGRTQEMNFFNIDKQWRLVDLPGYGYAKVSKSQRDRFNEFVSEYVLMRESLRGVFVLIDSRHTPQKLDQEFVAWLVENEIPFALVFTKTDKVKPKLVEKHIKLFTTAMKDWCDGEPTVFRSSVTTREGQREILGFVDQALAQG